MERLRKGDVAACVTGLALGVTLAIAEEKLAERRSRRQNISTPKDSSGFQEAMPEKLPLAQTDRSESPKRFDIASDYLPWAIPLLGGAILSALE